MLLCVQSLVGVWLLYREEGHMCGALHGLLHQCSKPKTSIRLSQHLDVALDDGHVLEAVHKAVPVAQHIAGQLLVHFLRQADIRLRRC